jgi:iron only hydrogenase large subunit-like protein
MQKKGTKKNPKTPKIKKQATTAKNNINSKRSLPLLVSNCPDWVFWV